MYHVHVRCRGGPDTHMWNYVVGGSDGYCCTLRTYDDDDYVGGTTVAVHSCCHGGHRFFDGWGGLLQRGIRRLAVVAATVVRVCGAGASDKDHSSVRVR